MYLNSIGELDVLYTDLVQTTRYLKMDVSQRSNLIFLTSSNIYIYIYISLFGEKIQQNYEVCLLGQQRQKLRWRDKMVCKDLLNLVENFKAGSFLLIHGQITTMQSSLAKEALYSFLN